MGWIQNYEWGMIEWLTDQTRKSSENVDIGIATIFPMQSQQKHIHYGDDQWLYILEGTGISVVDQTSLPVSPGMALYIPAGAVHETRNTGDNPLSEILISYPRQIGEAYESQTIARELSQVAAVGFTLTPEDIHIIGAFGETLALPISVYNTENQHLHTVGLFPQPCKDLCSIHSGLDRCHIYTHTLFYSSPAYSEQTAHYCKYGMAVIDTPIVCDNAMVGIIRGGHILTEDDANQIHPTLKKATMNLSNVPKGRLRIILNQYKKLAAYLAHSYGQQLQDMSSSQSPDPISTASAYTALREDLNLALGQILNLQINNHFLFNTLNAIAGMALEEKAFDTYRSIVDLSRLFRYSLKKNKELVTLKDELDFIKNYLALQRIRFGQRLHPSLDVPEHVMDYAIPFSTLQPLVENAFIHGFSDHHSDMAIAISVHEGDSWFTLTVRDNGKGIANEPLAELTNRLQNGTGPHRGLSMVIERMKLFFGMAFRFEIDSRLGDGLSISMTIPKRRPTEHLMGGRHEEDLYRR